MKLHAQGDGYNHTFVSVPCTDRWCDCGGKGFHFSDEKIGNVYLTPGIGRRMCGLTPEALAYRISRERPQVKLKVIE